MFELDFSVTLTEVLLWIAALLTFVLLWRRLSERPVRAACEALITWLAGCWPRRAEVRRAEWLAMLDEQPSPHACLGFALSCAGATLMAQRGGPLVLLRGLWWVLSGLATLAWRAVRLIDGPGTWALLLVALSWVQTLQVWRWMRDLQQDFESQVVMPGLWVAPFAFAMLALVITGRDWHRTALRAMGISLLGALVAMFVCAMPVVTLAATARAMALGDTLISTNVQLIPGRADPLTRPMFVTMFARTHDPRSLRLTESGNMQGAEFERGSTQVPIFAPQGIDWGLWMMVLASPLVGLMVRRRPAWADRRTWMAHGGGRLGAARR